jgi:TPR repeat protein
VEKDYAEALKWRQKAADQGHAYAQYGLGCMYRDGRGVSMDDIEAYAYFNLAARSWEPAAKAREHLEKDMFSDQAAQAQKRTKELQARIKAP